MKYIVAVVDHLTDGHLEQAAGLAEIARLLYRTTRPAELVIRWEVSHDGALHTTPTDYLKALIEPIICCNCEHDCWDCGCTPVTCKQHEVIVGYEVSVLQHGDTGYNTVGWRRVLDGKYSATLHEAKALATLTLNKIYAEM